MATFEIRNSYVDEPWTKRNHKPLTFKSKTLAEKYVKNERERSKRIDHTELDDAECKIVEIKRNPRANYAADYFDRDKTMTPTEWARSMSELRAGKPRPIAKLYGRNGPTELQAMNHAAEMRAWNSLYNYAKKMYHKSVLDRENTLFHSEIKRNPRKVKKNPEIHIDIDSHNATRAARVRTNPRQKSRSIVARYVLHAQKGTRGKWHCRGGYATESLAREDAKMLAAAGYNVRCEKK